MVIIPLLPGLAYSVTPKNVNIDTGLRHLYSINYLYGFCLSFTLYFALNYFWPDRATLIPAVVPGVVRHFNCVDWDLEAEVSVQDKVAQPTDKLKE
jgi:NCS1 family nucleobase:cation symporter-1